MAAEYNSAYTGQQIDAVIGSVQNNKIMSNMTYDSTAGTWTINFIDGTTETVDGPSIPNVSGYMPKAGGTFTGAVKAATADTSAYYVRNIKFSTEAETPTTEGDICFKLA